MGLFSKLIPLGAVGYLWLRAPEQAQALIKTVQNGPKAVVTSMDMSNIRNAIYLDHLNSESWPSNLDRFIQENFKDPAPVNDRWGTPYRLEQVPQDPVLVSCGPDQECGTADDIKMKVMPKKKKSTGGDTGPDPTDDMLKKLE